MAVVEARLAVAAEDRMAAAVKDHMVAQAGAARVRAIRRTSSGSPVPLPRSPAPSPGFTLIRDSRRMIASRSVGYATDRCLRRSPSVVPPHTPIVSTLALA